MAKCSKCNIKSSAKQIFVDGLCSVCLLKRNNDEEQNLLSELAEEQTSVGSTQFWKNMKRLFDVKFDNFEKKIETNLKQQWMEEIKAVISVENREMKEDIEALKLENRNQGDKIKEMEKMLEDLRQSVEMTDQTVRETKDGIEKKQKNNMDELKRVDKENGERADIAEDRSRRNNLRIGGIEEDRNEDWAATKAKVKNFFRNTLHIEGDIPIQRAHRSKADNQKDRGPRTIVLQLLNYENKEQIMEQGKLLKGTGYFISSDYCWNTVQLHKKLWKDVLDLRKEGYRAFLGYRKVEKKGCFVHKTTVQ